MVRVYHFLAGSSLRNLIALFHAYGCPQGLVGWMRAALIFVLTILRSPFTLFESFVAGDQLNRVVTRPDPIFIIGHWRSGTTYLHELLAKDPALYYLPYEMAVLPWNTRFIDKIARTVMRFLLPKTRLMDGVELSPEAPAEEGLALANCSRCSFYHSFYFPRQRERIVDEVLWQTSVEWKTWYLLLLKKMTARAEGRQLLLKDPANTLKIESLLSMFPEARFVYLKRPESEVLESTKRLYVTLYEELGLQTSLGDPSELIETIYARFTEYFESSKSKVPETQLIEIEFHDLVTDPVGSLSRIYSTLKISGFTQARPEIERFAEKKRNYRPKSQVAALSGS